MTGTLNDGKKIKANYTLVDYSILSETFLTKQIESKENHHDGGSTQGDP